MRSEIHDQGADDAHQNRGRERHQRHRGQTAHHVGEQTLHAAREHPRFAILGVIALDDAHAAQRLGQTSGDFRVDLAAFAEDGAHGLESFAQDEPEYQHDGERNSRHQRTDPDQHDQRDDGRQYAADELDHAGADQVAHALDVRHDARNQLAGLVRIVVGDGQPADMLLDLAAQFGDEFLARDGKQLSERKGCDALDRRRAHYRERQWQQQRALVLIDHVIDQIARGIGEYDAATAG